MDFNRLITFTQELIRERSLSGKERDVVEKITREMSALGFDEIRVDPYGSAVGIIHGKKPGKTLLLDGHCDTVDVIPSDWKHDPFAAVIDGDSIYGRGAADMKGSLAAMIHAAANVNREQLAGSVAVSATVTEEVMEGVALKPVMDALHPDCVIIGEATNFTLNHAGRGRAEIVAETCGRSAHSSSPQAGLCAVHEMLGLMQAIESMPLPYSPLTGAAIIVLTDIISEPYPGHSVVPNRCRVSYDRRLVPGETPESLLDAIRALPALKNIQFTLTVLEGEETTYTGQTLKGLKFFPAWAFTEDHPMVQSALRGLRSAGFEPRLGAYQFCTNGAYSAGIAGVPTLGFGPGSESDAHTVDEHIRIDDLRRTAEGLSGIIREILS